jgi:hypothetical protein
VDVGFVTEIVDTELQTLSGILEYGLGFWSKFLYNGKSVKLIEKPEWMGLARFATRK